MVLVSFSFAASHFIFFILSYPIAYGLLQSLIVRVDRTTGKTGSRCLKIGLVNSGQWQNSQKNGKLRVDQQTVKETFMIDEKSSFEIEAKFGRKGKWNLTVEPESIIITAADGKETFEIKRSEAEERIELRESKYGDPLMTVLVPKRIIFSLNKEAGGLVKKWLGPPTIKGLKVALKRRLKWSIPIAIVFIVSSMPFPADPEMGREAVSLDLTGLVLGATLLGLALLSRVWPRRELFVLDALWFTLLGIDVLVGVIRGNNVLWLIVIVFLLAGAAGGISEYKRFARMKQPQA
jgi:hypothetical protein